MQIEFTEQQILDIAGITFSRYGELENLGVLGGQSGIALFQFYCAKYFDNDQFAENGVEIISSCVDLINNGYSYPTYSDGIAGFGWALHHLNKQEFIELDLDGLLAPFDDYLGAQMELDLSNGNYDFLHGASGYAFYFLECFKNNPANNLYKSLLEKFVLTLSKMAIREEETIKWISTIDQKKGIRGYNLSLSHGMSSIIYILTKIHTAGIEQKLTFQLIRGACKYILLQEDKTKKNISLFPNWVEPNKPLNFNSRIAWCYGDIGIGKALELASKCLDDQRLKKKSLETLLQASVRVEPDTSFVVDSGICHGSFGNALIFNTLFNTHQNLEFKIARDFWFEDGLKRNTGKKLKPYKQYNGLTKTWELRINLLEGLAGIGLSQLDFLSNEENNWNECLMLC